MNTAHNTPENAKVLLLNHFIFSNTGTSDKELKGELLQAMGTVTLEWEKQEIKEKILNFAQELLQIARHTNHIWESGYPAKEFTEDQAKEIADKYFDLVTKRIARNWLKANPPQELPV